MAVRHTTQYYYEAGYGPNRQVSGQEVKQGILPQPDDISGYGDLQSLAEEVVAWGNQRWLADHGSRSDHLNLLNFVNVAMQLIDQGWSAE
jgi:hypothetical protein